MLKFSGWNPFKTKSLWQGVDYLDLIPRHRLEWRDDAAGGPVVVLVPRYRDFLFGRLVQPRLGPAKRFLQVPLEGRGSFLWRQVDGQRTVADLCRSFVAEFPEDAEDAAKRVSVYLHAMYDNGFIQYVNISELGDA